MKEPKEVDNSNFILSPMPGRLVSYAIEVSLLQNNLYIFDISLVETRRNAISTRIETIGFTLCYPSN